MLGKQEGVSRRLAAARSRHFALYHGGLSVLRSVLSVVVIPFSYFAVTARPHTARLRRFGDGSASVALGLRTAGVVHRGR